MAVTVELITASWCPSCAAAERSLRRILEEVDDGTISFRMVDALQELDYVVSLGVISTPAIAIDGALAFSGLPADEVLRQRLRGCLSAKLGSRASGPETR